MATQKRRQEQGLDSEAQQAALLLEDADEHLVDLPGVRRVRVNLTGKALERSLLWRLDWVNFLYVPILPPVPRLRKGRWVKRRRRRRRRLMMNSKVLGLATAGYRTDALKIVVGQVMVPRGLIGLGQDTIDFSTFEMKEVFDILANTTTIAKPNADEHKDGEEEKSAYPLLLHCTQGKDRTGMLILLLLLLTRKVPDEAISADYVRSEPELVVEAEERLKELHAMGIPEDFLKCPAGFTGVIRTYLEERYAGVEGYLALIGIDAEMQEGIRGVLVV